MEYKHYIKIDENNNIVDTFSNWQTEKFDGTEILYQESNERHFNLNLFDAETGIYIKIWDGSTIKDKDISIEKDLIIQKNSIKSQLYDLDKDTRPYEDLINALNAKNILKKIDLPQEAQDKIALRKSLRAQLKELE